MAVNELAIVRFQTQAGLQATAPFPVVPAGVQPVPAVHEVRQAWAEECVAVALAVVAGADNQQVVVG